MKPLRLPITFKKDGSTLTRLLFVIAIILAGAFVVFAILFVQNTLDAAFAVPSTSPETVKAGTLLSPDLIENVRAAQEARLAPAPAIPSNLYDPFAPVVIPPSTPAPAPVTAPTP